MFTSITLLTALSNGIATAQCSDADCGMPTTPNYWCSDGDTWAGPSECMQTQYGTCEWTTIPCPVQSHTGYLRSIDNSYCSDGCAEYLLEDEVGQPITNVTDLNNMSSLIALSDRFVTVTGEDVWCGECGGIDVSEITLSQDCPHTTSSCIIDPCSTAQCEAQPDAECVPNYCDGCHADFYADGQLVLDCVITDCDNPSCDDEALQCEHPSPQACQDNSECPNNSVCVHDDGCYPSICTCDQSTGDWICTADCHPGRCMTSGDLNNDGTLNVIDVLSITNLIVTGQYDSVGDVNEDESVNILDVIEIINAII